jgi:cytochrome c oxidase subunit 2
MWFNIPFFPESASSMSGHVDALYFFILANVIFFTVLVALLVIFFAIRYRRSAHPVPADIHGSMILEVGWTVIPLGIAMVMFAWGAIVYFKAYRPPQNSMEVYVVGKQWMWKFQHPEGVREINELHVPANRDVRVIMTSQDVIHDLGIPDFRLKGDVVPGRYSSVWFRATKPGRYKIFCDQYCGTLHSGMVGEVIVMEPAQFQSWLSGGGEGSMAQQGERLFQQLGCNTCHREDSLARGPSLVGLFGKPVKIADGRTLVADETYIRESILTSQAKLVAGYQGIMPVFQGQISEEGILQLIRYIQELGKQAPPAGPIKTSPSEAVPGTVSPGAEPAQKPAQNKVQ